MPLDKPASPYTIELPAFSGPLDLLLFLIDREELDITAISLARVTEQYLAQIESLKKNRMEQLIDFLVIGARLVLIKSSALLPQETSLGLDGEEEEDPAEALIRQLRQYRQFKRAAFYLKEREEQGLRTYLRVAPPPKRQGLLDLSGITVDNLIAAVLGALSRVENLEESVSLIGPRQITVKEQMDKLRSQARAGNSISFETLLSPTSTRLEIAVTLLAVLEMIKRREIVAIQEKMFGPILIVPANGDQSSDEAFVVEEMDG
jgi:segregation and condensation protein A